MSENKFAEMRRLVVRLRTQVDSLRSDANTPAARRVANSVERLEIDLAELARSVPAASDQRAVVVVPDTPYDPALWSGADDEGVGGHRRDHA
ncbi:hypothetical protein [Saccharothrix syringae]|uniref:Uncharacterized protein n=1 Tax=Saccharothrix syringae TaxID=103733 RepID=A0A5Q0GV96_SACSY|nr:hypothetical protein [Saccharothrix syringae]QFZ17889.1 hypothetical protein EKG83_10715 [Saccharothrix syringae]